VPDDAKFLSASAESASYLPRYQALARELDISIVPGTICEVHGPLPGSHGPSPPPDSSAPAEPRAYELRNMCYFIAAGTGEVAGTYQKKNLWHPERAHLTSSGASAHTAFDTPLRHADGRPVRAGLLVCWDLAFPEAFRELVADGAELVLVPSYWYVDDVDAAARAFNPDSEVVFLDAVTLARACESSIAVAFCNAGGCSQVSLPLVGSRGRIAPSDRDEMSLVEVDLEVLRVAERNYKVRDDMLAAGWHYSHTLRERKG